MAVQPTLLLIADIAGYTRFMKMHDTSLAHAQQIIADLLEAVIDAAGPNLKLAKLEGDAAFFYMPAPADDAPRRSTARSTRALPTSRRTRCARARDASRRAISRSSSSATPAAWRCRR